MATTTAELIDGEIKRDLKGRRITPLSRRVELVAGYRLSGLTMEQYARREGIRRHTFAKWVYLQKHRPTVPPVQFAEVRMGLPLAGGWAFEVTLPGGMPVRVASAAGLVELLNLMRK